LKWDLEAALYNATVVFDEKRTTLAKIIESLVSGGFPVRGEPQFLN
jgi:copper chaperone CopZ